MRIRDATRQPYQWHPIAHYLHWLRWLTTSVLLACAPAMEAAPLFRLESSLDNNNWFPVEREIMQEVVTDSAISELSSDFDFLLVSANDPRAEEANVLRLDATLIEPAQDIKVVAEAVVDGRTRQAEVVTDVETTDHSAVVRSLARAGRKVAQQLVSRIKPAASARDPTSEEFIETQRLLNQAAQLKREGKYEQGYAALRLILSQKGMPAEIRESVKEELDYRLPLYQAEDLMDTYRELKTPEQARAHYRFIESILRETLNQNLEHPERQRKLNQRLDTLYQIREYRLRSMKAQAHSQLAPLQTTVVEHMQVSGSMSEQQFRELVDRYSRTQVQVHEFDSSGRRFDALVETENGYRFRLHYDRSDRVTIKPVDSD
jgi:hypothetical protein